MRIIYEADDGKIFSNETDCLRHENEIKRREKNEKLKAARDTDNALWEKYFPEDMENKCTDPSQAYIWLEADIPAILRRTEDIDETIEEIKCFIYNYTPLGPEIIKDIDFERARKEMVIRRDFASALKEVKCGSDLSSSLRYSLGQKDLKALAGLHKSNKCRKKIEDLLTSCNFHSACGDFANKRYAEYLE